MIKVIPTFNSASGTFTSIDLTLCSPSLLFFSWVVGPDPCGSDHFKIILKGFWDGRWQKQAGMNFSIYTALICTNLPWMMLMIPCLCSFPFWRILQNKLFLILWQFQNVSIRHGFLTDVKIQSKSATGSLSSSNVNQPGISWMPITLLGLRLAEISNTVKKKHLGEVMSPRWSLKHRLNLYGIGSAKSRERNPVTLFIICLTMI